MKVCGYCGRELERHDRESNRDWARRRYCDRSCAERARRTPPGHDREDAFLRRLEPVEGGCRVWTGPTDTRGYGVFKYHGVRQAAHRAAWEIANGPIPGGLFVLHRCDNPPCCNTDHLWLGTRGDNSRDMWEKGRNVTRCGEQHGRAKLTEAAVRDIRRRAGGGATYTALAREHGVSLATVRRAVLGLSWSHVG